MIDEPRLRDGLARLLTATENNIRSRCDDETAVNRPLQERYDSARKAGRTGLTFNVWRDNEITQAGVAWLLACVFVRFLEDNDLLGEVYLAGPDGRSRSAQERKTHWYRAHPLESDREYLLDIFSELVRLPGMKGLLDRDHNPLWSLGPDGEGAKAILDFFQSTDPDTGLLRHDFTDTARSTRFLGDLYQNISESARKRYALLQTPDFIVDFILDRTLTRALDEFGLDNFRLIDPACGSGHFLLEAFDRLFRRWANRDGDLTVVVRHALDSVYGVDLNPYAAAIARFRLLIAAVRACGIRELGRAPDWPIHVTAGDSLLFGPHGILPGLASIQSEDPEHLRLTLHAQSYHVVVGNPPYINVQDPELRRIYRSFYITCAGSYQLSVPFTELLLDLAEPKGWIGMITSNAFMKRRFGKRLIEEYLPRWDLSHAIDTSGAYLPGHATPTTLLFIRKRQPISGEVRVVRGKRGETVAPENPAEAPVWREIRDHVEQSGFEGNYVSVANADRQSLRRHPWSIGGGGAAELRERISEAGNATLSSLNADLGYGAVTREDDVFAIGGGPARRAQVSPEHMRALVDGEDVREWTTKTPGVAIWPYGKGTVDSLERFLWTWRTQLRSRVAYGQTQLERGLHWYEYSMYFARRFQTVYSMALQRRVKRFV